MKKTLQNKLIKLMSEMQNSKKKLNAGQFREVLTLQKKAVKKLTAEEKVEFIKSAV